MVGQYRSSEEEEWEVVSVHRLHSSEQGLPKRSFPHASDRPAIGCHCRPSLDELFGLFLRLPPDTFSFGQSKEDNLCYSYWELLLQSDAFWFKECKGYLPKDDDQDV